MKNNQPVTNIEKPFLGDKPLVSKTDLKGIITYASDSFVAQSGFTRQELIGKNHNIIRHPDVPPEAFRQMWDTIQAGKPWRGTVKNRAKNGDHYWVDAFVVPIYEDGRITSYMSARTAPTREQIDAAEELYRELAAGKPLPAPRRPLWPASLRGRLAALVAVLVTIICIGGTVSLWTLNHNQQAMEDAYHARLEPVRTVGRIMLLMSEGRTQAMLALEHRPGRPLPPEQQGTLDEHLAALERHRDEIAVLTAAVAAQPFDPEERRLVEAFVDARDRYIGEGLNRVLAAIRGGDFDQADEAVLRGVHPRYLQVSQQAENLMNQLLVAARAENEEAGVRFQRFRLLSLAAMVGSVVLAVLVGLAIARQLMRRIGGARAIFERMAQGRLSNEIDLSIPDEMGDLMDSLASMQVQLRVMMDEIGLASETMEQRVRALSDRIYDVAAHSEEQQDAVIGIVNATAERGSAAQGTAQGMEEAARAVEELVASLAQAEAAQSRAQACLEQAQAALAAGDAAAAQRHLQDAEAESCLLRAQCDSLLPLGQQAEQATGAAAAEVRLQVFANEEVAEQMRRISALISENRQAVQDNWQFAQDLKCTAGELKALVGRFE